MYPKGGKYKIGGQILSLAINSSGQIIWVGNDKVIIVIQFVLSICYCLKLTCFIHRVKLYHSS